MVTPEAAAGGPERPGLPSATLMTAKRLPLHLDANAIREVVELCGPAGGTPVLGADLASGLTRAYKSLDALLAEENADADPVTRLRVHAAGGSDTIMDWRSITVEFSERGLPGPTVHVGMRGPEERVHAFHRRAWEVLDRFRPAHAWLASVMMRRTVSLGTMLALVILGFVAFGGLVRPWSDLDPGAFGAAAIGVVVALFSWTVDQAFGRVFPCTFLAIGQGVQRHSRIEAERRAWKWVGALLLGTLITGVVAGVVAKFL